MTIHSEHPFAVPPEQRDAARRFRGRLVAPVTLWCAEGRRRPAGLTVSSVLVAAGEPARVLGLIDPDSDLADALAASGRFTVSVLGPESRRLADAFNGTDPAPGGPFAQASFEPTPWGPRPAASESWVGAEVESIEEVGWSALVRGVIAEVAVGDSDVLAHIRGRYRAVGPDQRSRGADTGPGRRVASG